MNYQQEAAVTESPKFYAELIRLVTFESALTKCIQELRNLDKIKKALFYGRGSAAINTAGHLDARNILTNFPDKEQAIRIIHGVVGVATEACEMLELLFKVIVERKDFDEVNLMEECGDVFWYLACCLNATDRTFEETQERNIAKLRTRFPEKFTEFDANNRNLEKEREILEKALDGDEEAQSKLADKQVEDFKTPADMLAYLGTDADKWAKEFISRLSLNQPPLDVNTMRGWFAAAIEQGKAYEKAKYRNA